MTADHTSSYRLGERADGGALLGLRLPQVLLTAGGLAALVLLPATTHNLAGLLAGAVLALLCAVTAFARAGAEPVYVWAPILAGYLRTRIGGRGVWLAPLPLLTGTPPTPTRTTTPHTSPHRRPGRRGAALPRCLTGLELLGVDRPPWAGRDTTLAPVGLVRDRRHETLTVVLGARGARFALLEPSDQHARMDAWGQVLAQFGREVSPVVRLGWTLFSAPASPGTTDGHAEWIQAHQNPSGTLPDVATAYENLLNDTVIHRHDLRIWITVAAGPPQPVAPNGRRTPRHGSRPSAVDAALGAAKVFSDRCAAAGLIVSSPLSPVQIAEATRLQADPSIQATLATPPASARRRTSAPTSRRATCPGNPAKSGPAW